MSNFKQAKQAIVDNTARAFEDRPILRGLAQLCLKHKAAYSHVIVLEYVGDDVKIGRNELTNMLTDTLIRLSLQVGDCLLTCRYEPGLEMNASVIPVDLAIKCDFFRTDRFNQAKQAGCLCTVAFKSAMREQAADGEGVVLSF
jgi:hypothetical protein